MTTTTDKCMHCGKRIHLIKIGQSYKWVTDTRRVRWKCPKEGFTVHEPRDPTLRIGDRP